MIHADPEYDAGITGAMKIAHLCEALGLHVQFHACGPAHRAVMSAACNTHLYEMALIGPAGHTRRRRLRAGTRWTRAQCDLRLGVIERNRTELAVFE